MKDAHFFLNQVIQFFTKYKSEEKKLEIINGETSKVIFVLDSVLEIFSATLWKTIGYNYWKSITFRTIPRNL